MTAASPGTTGLLRHLVRPRELPAMGALLAGVLGAAVLIVAVPSASSTDVAAPALVSQGAGPLAGAPGTRHQLDPLSPPKPGTYRVRTTARSTSAAGGGTTSTKRDSTLQVLDLTRDASGNLHQSVESTGGQGSQRDEVVWRENGEYLVESSLGFITPFGNNRAGCRWTPPVERLPQPLAAGTSWSSQGTCRVSSGPAKFTLHQAVKGEVTGTRRMTVGGVGVDVYVIQMSTAIRQAGRFGGRSVVVAVTVQETSLLAPDYGLTVRSDTESASSVSNGGSAHSSSETVLESLTPGA